MAKAGLPPSFCYLVVNDFPPDRKSIESDTFKLADHTVKHLHYYLPQNCHLNVYIRSKETDREDWFPKSKFKFRDRNCKVLYFEMRGQVPKAGIFHVARFLQLYSRQTHSSTERRVDLEADDCVSVSQSVDLLQDMLRITLLRLFCSGMNYESAEDLQGVLLNTLNLQPKDLLNWLGNQPKVSHLREYFARFLESSRMRALNEMDILGKRYVLPEMNENP